MSSSHVRRKRTLLFCALAMYLMFCIRYLWRHHLSLRKHLATNRDEWDRYRLFDLGLYLSMDLRYIMSDIFHHPRCDDDQRTLRSDKEETGPGLGIWLLPFVVLGGTFWIALIAYLLR